MTDYSDAARKVAAANAYGSIYSSQYADAMKSARSNEMARRLGIAPDIVEADYPNMMAEDRLRRAQGSANASPRYASMMTDPRFAAAAIDDQHIHPLATAVGAHQDTQGERPASGFRSLYNSIDAGSKYLQRGLFSGLYSTAAAIGGVAEAFNPVSSLQDFGRKAVGVGEMLAHPDQARSIYLKTQVGNAQSTPFTRFAEDMTRRGQAVDQSPDTKAYSDLTYATLDPSKSALLSPVRMAHDVLQSLPTTAALAATVILTRGAAIKGEAAALAQGLEPAIAKQVGIKAAAKMASVSGALGEGTIGGLQQGIQTRTQVLDEKHIEESPMYKALIKSGIAPDDARQFLATQAGTMAGIDAGLVDAAANVAEGPILGRIIGEGGNFFKRIAKGYLTEGTTEAVQGAGEQVTQNAAIQEYADPHQNLTDGVVENVLQSFVVGGLTGGGFAAAYGHAGEAAHAEAAAANVDKVMGAAAQSSTRSANPSDFERVLHQQLDGNPGENLYIPADKVRDLFQSDSLSDDAFWSRYSDQIDQAEAIGGDVVIPLSEAATHLAGSPQWEQLREHVRASAGGMSLAEARSPKTTEELDAAAKGLAEHIDRVAPQIEAQRAVKEFVGGILPEGEQADKASQLLGANLAVQTANENNKRAARGEAPITPTEMFKRWNLSSATDASGSGTVLNQPAYHGSPHIFDKFSLDHIGTGEGAQAYGHGLYFAGKKEIAQHYKDVLAKDGFVKSNGEVWSADELQHLNIRVMARHNGTDLAATLAQIKEKEAEGKLTDSDMKRADVATLEKLIAEGGIKENKGRLYHVEIPDDGEYLLWDKPLSEQPPKVKAALEKLGIEPPPLPSPPDDPVIASIIKGALKYARVDDADIELTINNDSTLYNRAILHAERAGVDTGNLNAGEYVVNQAKYYVHALMRRELTSGENAYRELVGKMADGNFAKEKFGEDGLIHRADALASRLLQQAGIAGIKYADGGSRHADQDSHNYVIFDDNAVSIKHYEQNQGAGARGSISLTHDDSGRMSSAVIRAFKSANFSTFVHEMGHFWLEDLRNRALSPDATDSEKADWKAVSDWMFDNGHDASLAIPTDAHEMWARGMERYVYEGQAPSRGLKALFARMADWMKELYRSVAAFNSPITPEIREVMDRMFASDNEIEQQQMDMALASAHVEGLMTDAELGEYRKLAEDARDGAREKLYERVLSTLKREKEQEASARTKEIKAQITEAIGAQPVFAALKLLRSGIPDGEGGTNRARLSKRWLTDTYGEGVLAKMPQGVPPIMGDTDLIDPEHIAEEAGFDSADQMVKAFIDHEAQRQRTKASGDNRSLREAAIAHGVEQRVRAEIGDPLANLEEEAQAALANDRQAEAMSMELRALARKTGQKPTPWKMATAWAAKHIAGSKVRDSITGSALQMYARNAGKAGRQAEEALIKGEFQDAFRFKQQQMLNLALLSEGKKTKIDVEKAVGKMQGIASKKTIASVDQDYLDQAHQLLESVDLKARPLSRVDKRLAFEAWYAKQIEEGKEPIVPPEYRHILGTTAYQNLTNDELLELNDVVSQIIKLGRLKQELIDGKEARDLNDAIEEMQASAEQGRQRKRTKANDPSRVLSARAASTIRSVDSALIKLETIIDWLDNGDTNGPWNRMIFRRLSDAQGREADLTTAYAKEINESIKAVPRAQARRWARWVDTPELVNNIPGHPERGSPMKFGMDQIVMMAMNWGNEGSRQRLVDGFGWDEDVVKGVMDRLMTKDDWDFVQKTWDTVDKLWPELAAMERRVNGVAPPKVEAVEVHTPHGVYKGGYFPAVYDSTYSTTTQLQEQEKLSPNGAFFKATTRAGSTRERVAAVKGRPLLLNLGVITRHMSEVIHDITHREAINQVNKILTSRRIRTAVDNALGPEYLKTMESVVSNIATPGQASSKSHPALNFIARRINKGISIVGMGLRVSTVLQQPLGLANLAGTIGERGVAEGMGTFIAHPAKTYNEVVARSAEMRHRFSNMDATIHAMWEDHKSGKLQLMGPGRIDKVAFQGIAYADALVTIGGWTGAYNKALREGMAEDDAVYYADKAIRVSQGAGGAKDQSPIQFDNVLTRAFVPFFSYLNANYNQRRDVGHKLRRAESVGDVARGLKQYWWVATVPSLMMALLFGQGPDDDTFEAWAEYLLVQQILGGLSTIPGIGPLANALGNGYGYRASPWQMAGENVVKTAKDAKAAVDGNDDTEVSKSWIKNSLYVVGVITAKPLGQIGATAQGIHDYATGEADPQNTRDWYNLMTTGRIPQAH